ncbi:MAG: fasciclin domain-containing protein, partial [Bacteroidales bacterium]|nr:fasciclin domain-containing protein [Bacteroidales bacterium]
YHVATGKVMSGDLSDGQEIVTLLDREVNVTISEEGVFINNAKVFVADIVADNGVVHVLDAVLIPQAETVVDIIVGSAAHDTLEAAVIAAELADDLAGEGPFTVFAPTDAAFKALPAGTIEALLEDPTGDLADILLYHVATGKVMSGDLSDGQEITTLLGKDVTVTINEDGVFINDAKVILADLLADNGVVHVIDAVLIPAVEEAAFPIDFETETDAVWEVFANGTGSASDFEVIANPDKSGVNTSDNVLKFVVNANADTYAGAFSNSYAPVEFTQSSHTITLMVWKSIISPVGFKVEASTNGGPVTEVKVSNTVTNAWELLTFNMSACIGYSYDRIVIFPDFPETRTAGTTVYIDNIERKEEATGILNLDEDSKGLTIYPNPASGYIRLSGLGDLKEGMMRIINTGGVEVENRFVKDLSGTIDVSRLDQGAYFLILESGSNRYTGKLFKK